MCFDTTVPPRGYRWWYVDALSEDGRQGLTIIAFIGSVFSPYYAWARERGETDPTDHCGLNVALYGEGGKRWSLTERGRGRLQQGPDALVIGPSALSWDGRTLTIRIDETTVPIPTSLKGTVKITPHAITPGPYQLDEAGKHFWWPIGPCGHAEVAMEKPSRAWQGEAYLDSNWGSEPLEDGFCQWDWSRSAHPEGAAILYDMQRRRGGNKTLALLFDREGNVRDFDVPAPAPLPSTLWRVARSTHCEVGSEARVLDTFEDTPFYTRSLVATHLAGAPVKAVHESLSLDRFKTRWVKMLLPFRMPRLR
ncbi:carotenoid 1,2-hydratase [Afifella marina]|uniref:Carotenoid 1,2-hydratase n=1 Tax=Afifella marina DSM 2698 TaxID=1120955 RepID=A0A1G5P0T3_AFIMA|nr:carotenoid 1,2-hydratase [Afifella marina]MBK1624316.1 carotenoid 1,2-hydratase [Afifella marina DSM 2698]MBK1628048.1 carotenoid 1,2-hydratase [Afifella marina]MBK5918243.1 carotenoid 1,2-hydratase [Afifella marina]RAI19279.1 carotenoid 1,2-hydratase [Afifella marina DSM 2698]SCZ43157.1 carotenoid 1,2-hydratase [Afifella marina DSM 2698]